MSNFLSTNSSVNNVPDSLSGQLKITFEASEGTLCVCWEGEVMPGDIREGYSMIMDHTKVHKPSKFMLDLQKRHTIKGQDQLWVFKQVFPEILQIVGDDVFVAVILPLNLFDGLVHNLNGDELMCDNHFLIIQHFLYREEAQRWLEQMQLLKKGERSSQLKNTTI